MKEDLQKIIDEIQLLYAELEIDAELLYAPLQNVNYLTIDEVDLIVDRKTTTGKILTLFKLLKSKDDKVLSALQKIFHKQSRTDLLNEIQTKLMQTKNNHLIWISPSKPEPSIVFESTIQSVQENLKKHYQYDLELIEKYWSKFSVNGKLDMDTFYNYDILIRDKNRRVQDSFNSFGDIFETKTYKRFVIMANGGYGKSTFVHEMARQWTKGNEKWTEKFSFLFLFRLTELEEENTKSFQSLLSGVLSRQDSFTVSQWLQDASLMEKSLFIFDGLDELQHQFCDEIDDLIYGKGGKAYQAHVIVSSRPCKKLEELKSRNLYIELQGFTDTGAHMQLKKNFNINPDDIKNDLKAILKVPLFNTLFGITHKDATYAYLNLNLCTAIEMFVNFACNRYRNINPDFSETEKNELLLLLGQAAQNKFGFVALSISYDDIRKTDMKYPNVTQALLSSAIGTGLVYQKSTLDDFVYAHQTIAEYCAAHFWNETNSLKIKKIHENKVYLAEVETKGIVDISSSFSCFLSHFNTSYKQSIWRNFDCFMPLLNEYDTLPKLPIQQNFISLEKISPEIQNTILVDKIIISKYVTEYHYFTVHGMNFEEHKIIESLAEIHSLCLSECSLSISPKEFFSFYTVTSLRLFKCTFKDYLKIGDGLNEGCKNVELLEHLELFDRNYSEVNFLCYIMKYCKRLKTLGLHHPVHNEDTIGTFEINSRISWLIELENNSNLLNSIESVYICCCGDDDDNVAYCGSQWGNKGLAVAFRVLGKIVTLKYLDLRSLTNNLKKSDISTLNESFSHGWKNLVDINIEFRYEHWEVIDFKIRSACNLESIKRSLKELYKNDLELILNYLSTSDVQSSKSHQDIDIKQRQASYSAFERLFWKEPNSIFIITDTVYSRYSFVSEIVRQWLTPQNSWTDNFIFLFWFRLNEISSNEPPSLLSLLTRCLSVTDSVEAIRLLKDANYMKRCLFIFDGLDEMRGSSFCEQVNDIIFGSEVHARILVTTQQCRKIEKIKRMLRDHIFINFNEHNMKQKNEDYGMVESVELGNELSKILKNSLSVKMTEIALYLLYHGEHNLILGPDLLKEMVEKMLTMVETSKNALHLHKNVWQTFCLWKNKDNICYSEAVDILRCSTAALESMISCNDEVVTQMTMEIVSTLISTMSMKLRILIGKERRYVRGLLQIISRIVGKPLKCASSLDIKLDSSITSLMYLTDASATTCSFFVDEDGLVVVTEFLNLFRIDSTYDTTRLHALQLLYNVAEVTNLKTHFHNSSYLSYIVGCGKYIGEINEVFFAAGILAQICPTLSRNNVQPTSKECLEHLMRTIKRWTEELEEPANLTVHLNNLNGFLTLMSNNNFPSVHLWALWAIRHLCSVDNAKWNVSNEVVDAVRCCSAALESMITCNDDTVNRMAVEIISKLLQNMSTKLRTSLGTNRRYMRALLKVIDEKSVHQSQTTFNSDTTLISTIDSLVSLTDESPSTCLCFNEENGFVVIFKVLEIYKTYPKCDKLLYFTLLLLGNISEVPSLSSGFLNMSSYLDTIISFLKLEINQSYFSCRILANLCSMLSLNWDNIQPTRNECLKYLERTTSEWAKNNTLDFKVNSLKPFITLIESEFPAVQLWAVWTIRHILSLNAKYYGDMFMTEGGQKVLSKVGLATALINADIRNICEDISTLLSLNVPCSPI